jgi:hypothetical protein
MAEASIGEFMSRVMPWPQGHGFVNLHWRTPNPRDTSKDFWHGKPVQNVPDFLGLLTWVRKQPQTKDIYFCLSLQSQSTKNKRGNIVAVRSSTNALMLKSIWLDIDIKEPPKGYATLDEALAALEAFCVENRLPSPSALVGSGGGLHVYWISNRPLPPDEWQEYANGLKAAVTKFGLRCDAGCTIDAARVLRVPNTFNFKTQPPRPVKLLAIKEANKDYDFAEKFGHIRTASATPKTAFDLSNFPKRTGKVESLAEGLDKPESKPLAWKPVVDNCAFVRNALQTQGRDYSQPMWNLTTLIATFMEEGHDFAHLMSRGHKEYDPEKTEELWQRKVREREQRGLGYPSCNAIQAAGCTDCATCPLLSLGKSPLNITAPVAKTVEEDPFHLPDGYELNEKGEPCFLEQKKVRGEVVQEVRVPVFFNKLVGKPWTQADPDTLHFEIIKDVGGRRAKVSIRLDQLFNGTELWSLLQGQGLKINLRDKCEKFLMSWMAKLESLRKAQESSAFGWMYTHKEGEEGGEKVGFCYGGKAFHKGGIVTPAGFGREKLRVNYAPRGTIEPWFEAAELILGQKRPELAAIMAASFATPLVDVTGYSGIMFSAHGSSSGEGKSSAVHLGTSVWGHPKLTKAVTDSTPKRMMEEMGEIANLPLYWDEIREDVTRQKVLNLLFTLTEGVTPGRLTQSADFKGRHTWKTAVVICSNYSFADYVLRKEPTTPARLYRVLEWHVPETDKNRPGMLANDLLAEQMIAKLEHNYGQVGMRYAEMLGSDPEAAYALVNKIAEEFKKEVRSEQGERFWSGGCAALIAGATLAKQIGVNFDVDALRSFMLDVYEKNRNRIASEYVQGGSEKNTLDLMVMFLKDNMANTLYTDEIPMKAGHKVVNVLHGPRYDMPKPIYIHYGVSNRVVRISRRSMSEYFTQREIAMFPILKGLGEHFKAEFGDYTLGGGTVFRGGPERAIDIPIPPGSPFEDLMNAYKQAKAQ